MVLRRKIATDLLADLGFSPTSPARPQTFLWDTFVEPQWPAILADLEAVGILPEAVTVDAATGLDRSQAGEFDVNFWGFMAPRADPDMVLYDHYHSTGTMNFGKYASAELDGLIDEQSRTIDLEERRQLVKEASQKILRDNAKVWGYWLKDKTSVPTWVMDYHWTLPSNQNTSSRLTRTWIDAARMATALGQ
jgi:ABC-type transport system substrate-binding protein